MSSTLFGWLQHLLPQRLLGLCVRKLAQSRRPTIKTPLIRWFARHYAVDLAEAERPALDDYASFNEFFTRALRPGVRPLAPGESTLISPADGRVTEFGTAIHGQALQAKGMPYQLEELLGPPPAVTGAHELGDFVTVYLAPHNYHRVHLPLAGALTGVRYFPGKRFSVNAATARTIPRLFCRNERLVAWFETAIGPVAVVLVGALNVAGISTPWLGEVSSAASRFWEGRDLGQGFVERGAEIGRFNLGSTVIVVLPSGSTCWDDELVAGQAIRMGARLGSTVTTDSSD